jgi:hypothetical protein
MASIFSALASHERQMQDWQYQRQLAQEDIAIGSQQVQTANDNLAVAQQEQYVAQLQAEHAKATADFLANKLLTAELYSWMRGVLGGVYRYFLQQATAMARLAQDQLAFERQNPPPSFILADYWQVPTPGASSNGTGGQPSAPGTSGGGTSGQAVDRQGLTGSARLLEDIYQLDQYAFATNQRKLQLTKTISLAQLAPVAFQQFRDTGVLPFTTTLVLFDREWPGHYLRLIRRVRTSVLALVPPALGIRATLETTGVSRVTVGGDVFQTVVLQRDPESVALSSPSNATGLFELEAPSDTLLPFEFLGVAASWRFLMPRAANPIDYSTIADILITIDYTAFSSVDYRRQVIRSLDWGVSSDRGFSFLQDFPDRWYDLNNPESSATPMTVRFSTKRDDFPPNVLELAVQDLTLYFDRGDATFEVPVTGLSFQPEGSTQTFRGGSATSIDGIISTRSGNGVPWMSLCGPAISPVGEWTLDLKQNDATKDNEIRGRFKNGEIKDVLLVITYSGRTPEWPD